ncbi:MAG TPA: EpsG family protein [Sphingobacterium sp.]|nr:EpsG family protein [Sphingobacterium sp.]
MSQIDHIFLFISLFLLFFYWGKNYYNIASTLQFWVAASVPIIAFSLIVGSRYGWGVDYLGYKFKLDNAYTFPEEQVGFRFLNITIRDLGLEYVGGFILYSLIFIIASFVLLRGFGKSSKYMYFFLILSTLLFVTDFIRQGLAMSFVLLTIYFLNRKNWISMALCIIIGASIHLAIIVSIAFILFFYVFLKRPIHWKITIPLYIFFAFLFDVSKIGFISSYIESISVWGKFQGYVDNSDKWFGEEAADHDRFQQGIFALLMSSIHHIAIIYLGYWALKLRKNASIGYIYNLVVFGYVFLRAVFLFEILKRLAMPLVMFDFIVVGYILYVFIDYLKLLRGKRRLIVQRFVSDKKLDVQFKLLMGASFIYLFMYWSRFIFLNPDAAFFW